MGLVPSLYDCDSILSVDYTVDDGKGGKEMIDAPMLKQVGWSTSS